MTIGTKHPQSNQTMIKIGCNFGLCHGERKKKESFVGEDQGIRKEERERKWMRAFSGFQRQLWVIAVRVGPYVMCVSRVALFRQF
jgi:hypothetical protein